MFNSVFKKSPIKPWKFNIIKGLSICDIRLAKSSLFVSLNIFGVEGNIRSPLSSLVCFVTTDENGLSCFNFDAEVFESYKISAD